MAIKKSELYSSLWKSCDELRGGMDASQYKDYVLVLLFMKYVSDRYAGKSRVPIEVPKGGSFRDMVALKGKKDIGDGINKVIACLAEANELKGVINLADFNNEDKLGKGKEMVDRLTNLVGIFEDPRLDFSKNRAGDDDLLGDAYEYLMRNFATESGKSKGQFYTPAEVSRVIARIIGVEQVTRQSQTIYDPTCGSGSLLLKAADETETGISIYGQEMDNATHALARMNMILHSHPTAEIKQGNTLAGPLFLEQDGGLKTFDFGVANPPFSSKSWRSGFDPEHDLYDRFEDGIPPAKNGDYAFLMHLLRSLKSNGKGAIILPHGVLFRGNVEGEIRKNLVRRGVIKGIIALPPNLFFGTGIPACIIVLDKENAGGRKGIFMIDASRGFIKDGNKNRLRHRDIRKIVDVFRGQIELPKYSRLVNWAEIEEDNDFNLNIPRYIDSSEPEDLQDIAAHLQGGIPAADIDALDAYWQVFPALCACLFSNGARPGSFDLIPASDAVRSLVYGHPEFTAHINRMEVIFNAWQDRHLTALKGIQADTHPKTLIQALSDDLLQSFAGLPLVNNYDMYQHLMTYWGETMQDDIYILVSDGWQANPELIPESLVIARYFAAEWAALEQLEAEKQTLSASKEEFEEEHSGEEGVLEELKSEKGKLSKGSVQKRAQEIKDDPDAADERATLAAYLDLLDAESAANKKVKDAQKVLAVQVKAKYQTLAVEEVKTLVVDDKWLFGLRAAAHSEMEGIAQQVARRVRELAERYAEPLPQLEAQAGEMSARVAQHLERMGFSWQ
jgi:type I restriction enzyme M protein